MGRIIKILLILFGKEKDPYAADRKKLKEFTNDIEKKKQEIHNECYGHANSDKLTKLNAELFDIQSKETAFCAKVGRIILSQKGNGN